MRNLAYVTKSKLILPWCYKNLVEYLSAIRNEDKYCNRTLKNKIFLRKILKENLSLDYDIMGKKGWTINFEMFIDLNFKMIEEEISNCFIWDSKNIQKYLYSQFQLLKMGRPLKKEDYYFIHNMFKLSVWLNKNIKK